MHQARADREPRRETRFTKRVPFEGGTLGEHPTLVNTRSSTLSGLGGYLNDHLAGAAAAIQLAERRRARERHSSIGQLLEVLIGEIREDRDELERVVRALGYERNPVKPASARVVELLASLRMSLPVVGTGIPEASRLEEIEVLSLGIEGKRMMWGALEALADPRLQGFDFAKLQRRASEQRGRLGPWHLRCASAAAR
jgi:hypothetical protein